MQRPTRQRNVRKSPSHWLRRAIVQAAEYLVSGNVYFFFGYAMFALLWSALHWPLFWAKISANFFGWAINYLLQRYWVFGNGISHSKRVRVTRRYAAITLADFLLDYAIVAGLRQLGITPYLGQFLSAGFFTFWNYAWYRFWVFPSRKRRA